MFDDADIERYARQIVLPEVGATGQRRLLAACVRVLGDTDGTCAMYLKAAGIGTVLGPTSNAAGSAAGSVAGRTREARGGDTEDRVAEVRVAEVPVDLVVMLGLELEAAEVRAAVATAACGLVLWTSRCDAGWTTGLAPAQWPADDAKLSSSPEPAPEPSPAPSPAIQAAAAADAAAMACLQLLGHQFPRAEFRIR